MMYLFVVLMLLALHLRNAVEDAELARQIRDGDHEAFKQFFDRYHGLLLNYLIKRGLGSEEAQDIVQNAFIMIWEKRAQIDPSRSIKAFLFRIGYTRALNHFRDTAKFDSDADVTLQETDGDIVNRVSFKQLQGYVHNIIQTMPERRRAVFELCFLEELTYREAAESLQISIKTVENHMALALKTMRAALAGITG